MTKIKYDVISPRTGNQEPFTGMFKTEKDADKWYAKHGKIWKERGKKLVKVMCGE